MQLRGKFLKWVVIATLSIGIFGGSAWLPSRPIVLTAYDAREAFRFVDAIEARYRFRVTSGDDRRPAVYAKPGVNVTNVFVYGNYSPQEQDEICAAARSVHMEIAGKPVHLYFYPRELQNVELMRREILK